MTPVSAVRFEAVLVSASCLVATRREDTEGIPCLISEDQFNSTALAELLTLNKAKMIEKPMNFGNSSSVRSFKTAWA
jgi:hypothetical protein